MLAAAATAGAGGNDVPVVVGGGTVWVAAAPWVLGIDAASRRIVRRVPLANAYPLALARGGGALWVASVENGDAAGAVTWIGPRGRSEVPLRLPHAPILGLATGAGAAWALVGPWPRAHLVRIDYRTRRTRTVPLPAGRPRALGGDGTTAIVVGHRGVLYRLTRARPRRVGLAHGLPVDVDRNGVWLVQQTGVAWLDLRDGRDRTILRGLVADVVYDGRDAFAIRGNDVVRFDPDGGRIHARRPLPGSRHLARGAAGLWVTSEGELHLLDPRTLAVRATIRL